MKLGILSNIYLFLAYSFLFGEQGQGHTPFCLLCIQLLIKLFYDIVYSANDRILIEKLCRFKGYEAKRLVKEFPEKKMAGVQCVDAC